MPFRWNISRPEMLGRLLDHNADTGRNDPGDRSSPSYRTEYDGFGEDLLACAARTIALAGDTDLVFVGRSPESLYDLLSGLLADTTWRQEANSRLTLLRYSNCYTDSAFDRQKQRTALIAFRTYLETLGLSPRKIIVRGRPVALVDLVCSGNTMRDLLQLFHDWTLEEKVDWPAVRRKLRVIALVRQPDDIPPKPRWKRRRDGSTRPWSWRTGSSWINELLERDALCEVALPSRLWDFLGNWQAKSVPAYAANRWGTEEAARPCHKPYFMAGLRAARRLYEAGCARETRERFASHLADEDTAMREAWARKLIQEIRGLHS